MGVAQRCAQTTPFFRFFREQYRNSKKCILDFNHHLRHVHTCVGGCNATIFEIHYTQMDRHTDKQTNQKNYYNTPAHAQ